MESYKFLNNKNNWLTATLLLDILALAIVLVIFFGEFLTIYVKYTIAYE